MQMQCDAAVDTLTVDQETHHEVIAALFCSPRAIVTAWILLRSRIGGCLSDQADKIRRHICARGGTDIFARAIAAKFTEKWGQSVIVDNRAGGNGNIGTDMVAKAPPDGYTILLTTNATIVINPHLSRLPYDPVTDLAPISQVATLPFVLARASDSACEIHCGINSARQGQTRPAQLWFLGWWRRRASLGRDDEDDGENRYDACAL
jgi:hypothetical protein